MDRAHGKGTFRSGKLVTRPRFTQLVAKEEPKPNPTGSKFCAHCVPDQKGQLEMLKNGKKKSKLLVDSTG